MRFAILVVGSLLVICGGTVLHAQPKTPFPEAKHGAGYLKHVEGITVVVCRGTPTEIGSQFGTLVGKNAPNPTPILEQFLADVGMKGKMPLLKVVAQRFKAAVPADHLAEMKACQEASGFELEMILLINSIYDLSTSMGCSTLIVEKERSKTGAPIFGRNFDWMPTKGLPEQTVVAVMEPKGKLAFALVTIAPIAGCVSGMNEAGLCLTLNEISIKQTKDKSTFNWDGIPTLLAFRRVLEECRTIDEAEKLLKSLKRTTCACMTICDAHGGAVLEITPKTVIRRTANQNVCCCTNHFRTDELCVDKKCSRIDTLLKLETDTGKLGVSEVFHQLDLVNQKAATLQSMVFEPTTHTLHLKLGDGKTTSSRAKSVMLKLSDYWGKK